MSGRRAAFNVALKNARRNPKRTFYLVVLIAVPVMIAVIAAAVFRSSYVTAEERVVSDFGQASLRVVLEGREAPSDWLETQLAELAPDSQRMTYRGVWAWFPDGNGADVVDLDLDSPLGSGILALTSGSKPLAENEVALSEHLAQRLEANVGDVVEITSQAGDAHDFLVVGLVSHPVLWKVDHAVVVPRSLDDVFGGFVRPTTLISVPEDQELAYELERRWEADKYQFYPDDRPWPMPSDLEFIGEDYYASMTFEQIDHARELWTTEGETAAFDYVYNELFAAGVTVSLPWIYAESRTDRLSWTGDNIAQTAPAIGTAAAALILAEVAFIAGAAFATGTRRRLREIGLMGANGASNKHVRFSVVGEGILTGVGGAALGSVAGVLAVLAGRPVIQRLVERRIEDFPVSPLDLVGPALVAVIACVLAAWLPARTASQVPTLTALQGRMPVSAPKQWVVPVGVALAGFGTLLLAVGLAGADTGAAVVGVVGAVLMVGGTALLSGPLVAWVAGLARRFPVTPRIVLRDSGRQRGRAAAAVSATMVIMILPVVGLAGGTSSIESDRIYGLEPATPQAVIRGQMDQETFETVSLGPDETEEMGVMLDRVLGLVPDAVGAQFLATDAEVAYPARWEQRNAGVEDEDNFSGGWAIDFDRMAIANDELLAVLDDARLAATLDRDGIVLIGVEERITEIGINGAGVEVGEIPLGVQLTSFPRVLVTPNKAAELGAEPIRTMALVVTPRSNPNPISYSPFGAVYEARLDIDLATGGSQVGVMRLAFMLMFAATLAVVLIVVATVTALSAAEADGDIETMVAVGAVNSIRRKYLGLQAGLHTLLATLLAVPLALLLVKTAMSSGWTQQTLGNFGVYDSSRLYVPYGWLAVLVVAIPIAVGVIAAVTVRSAALTPPRRAW